MILAVILSLVVWGTPAPTLWLCASGKSPTAANATSCEQLHFHVLGKFRVR